MDARYQRLVERFREGAVNRRAFVAGAAALGASTRAVPPIVGGNVRAQDATPDDTGELTPGTLGVPGVEHRTDTDKGTIALYSSWPMSGASEQFGVDLAEAVRFAIDIYGGAAGGYAITYTALDDSIESGTWDPEQELENALEAVGDDDAMVYIGTYNSGAAAVSIPVTNEGGMAMISPGNTAVALTKESSHNPAGYPDVLYPTGTRNYMRVCPADDIQGAAGAAYAIDELGARRIWVLHDDQLYGRGIAEIFRDTVEQLGGEVLGFEDYDTGAGDYVDLMQRIASDDPDLLYLGAIADLNAPRLLTDMRERMPADQVAFLGPDGLFNQALVEEAEEASDRAHVTFVGLPPIALDARGIAWYREMTDRLGHGPNPFAMYAFEAAVVALQAIDLAGEKDRAQILERMFGTTGFRGMAGTWSFTDTGDTSSVAVSVNQVRFGGHFVFQDIITPPDPE